MISKRKYYIWDDSRKEFVSDFMGCPKSSTHKAKIEKLLKERQKYEMSLSEEDLQGWVKTGLSYKYCYIMFLTKEEMYDFSQTHK